MVAPSPFASTKPPPALAASSPVASAKPLLLAAPLQTKTSLPAMASPVVATSSTTLVVLLLLAAFATSSDAATFMVTNRCPYKVCPGVLPGGGAELVPGATWTLHVPAGTSAARIWPRTGCAFDRATKRGRCATGDCAGSLFCSLSGKPPATLAEFNIGSGGAPDNYGISVVDGFNVPMDFSCSSGRLLRCRDSSCPDGNHRAGGDGKYHSCQSDSDYKIVF